MIELKPMICVILSYLSWALVLVNLIVLPMLMICACGYLSAREREIERGIK